MLSLELERSQLARPAALLLSASLLCPTLLAGCGGSPPPAQAPAPMAPRMAPPPRTTAPRTGLSGKQKVAILVGAAALYYLYKKHQREQAQKPQAQQVQYYLSKNGGVYYRDPSNPQHVIWVQPPTQGISVPETEAGEYRDFQGYNRSSGGRDLRGLIPTG